MAESQYKKNQINYFSVFSLEFAKFYTITISIRIAGRNFRGSSEIVVLVFCALLIN